ncbi:MAG: DUF2279 domain-containing protein, partial [Bacteroidetes bacterium]|nr:DUF2279 domain-containing protein [Bacteroidota bacterium]
HQSPTWLGCTAGFLAMTPIEILDGFSAQHGASWGDLIANAAGSGLVLGQYLLWDELRIYPKYSFHQTRFAPIRPNLLGLNLLQQSLKDYNGQTYWLSVNIASFLNNDTKLPPWLNVSFGYGAHGMLGGFENVWYQENNEIDSTDIQRYRQYYLSLDIDWMRIKTNRKFLKSLFYILNAFQIPVPALEFNAGRIADPAKKRLTLQLIYFTI